MPHGAIKSGTKEALDEDSFLFIVGPQGFSQFGEASLYTGRRARPKEKRSGRGAGLPRPLIRPHEPKKNRNRQSSDVAVPASAS